MDPSTRRHQWGPAPSGSNRHVSVCRRCGLREVSDWYDAPDGAIEVTTWLTPAGTVVGSRRIDSHQSPPQSRPLVMVAAVPDRPPPNVVRCCPGHPLGWAGRNETLGP